MSEDARNKTRKEGKRKGKGDEETAGNMREQMTKMSKKGGG